MSTEKVKDQGKHLGDMMNAATRITMNANTIMQQPDIKLDDPELQSLPEHQSAARGHCDVWLKGIWPSIINLTTDIIDYAITFDSSYQSLINLVPRLQKGDEEAKEELMQVFNELLPHLKDKQANSSKIASDTTTFQANFQNDYQKFLADYTAATKIYSEGELKSLQKKLKEAESLAHKLVIALIALGIGEGVLLGAMAVVSGITDDDDDGEAKDMMGGIVAIAKIADSEVGREYAKAMKDETDLQVKIAALKAQLHYLNCIERQIGGFANSLSDAETATQAVANEWMTLADELSSLISHFNKISPKEAAKVVTEQLSTSKADWDMVMKQAKALAPSGHIPVKQYQGIDSFLKDITPKPGAAGRMGDGMGATMNAATRITMYAHVMVKQPDITIQELPNLPQHQRIARTHAKTWLNTIWPEIIAVTKDIISYAQIFSTAYKELDGLVDRLKKGDEKAKDHFKMLLTDVLLVGYQKANISRVASTTETFQQALDADSKNFARDSETAKQAYIKEKQNLKELQTKEEAKQAEVKTLHAELIVAAAALAVLIAAMAVVSFFTGGEAAEALEPGIEAAKDTTNELKESYHDALQEEHELQSKIKAQQIELAKLNVVRNQLNGFFGGTSETIGAAQSVSDGWNALGDDLNDLIKKLDEISPQEAATVIRTQLSSSHAEWQVVLKQAEVLEPSEKIPVKQYDSMDAFLKAIAP